MVVPRDVSDTLSASTRMVGCLSRSMRLNRYQCCSGAGFRVMVTGLPVWSPTPEILISDLIVRCFTFIAVHWLICPKKGKSTSFILIVLLLTVIVPALPSDVRVRVDANIQPATASVRCREQPGCLTIFF